MEHTDVVLTILWEHQTLSSLISSYRRLHVSQLSCSFLRFLRLEMMKCVFINLLSKAKILAFSKPKIFLDETLKVGEIVKFDLERFGNIGGK